MTLYVKEFCHDKIYIFLLSVIHDFVLVNVPFSCIALFKQNKDEQILITMFLFTDQCKKGTPTRVQVSWLVQSSELALEQYMGLCPNIMIHGRIVRFSELVASCNGTQHNVQMKFY
jgi:hypothetical protein